MTYTLFSYIIGLLFFIENPDTICNKLSFWKTLSLNNRCLLQTSKSRYNTQNAPWSESHSDCRGFPMWQAG